MGVYILAVLFLAGGAIFGLLGYSNLVATKKRRASWRAVEGRVVALAEQEEEPGGTGRRKTLYAPVYRYAIDGVEYSDTSKISSSPARYQVGDPIRLLVNPANPSASDVANGDIPLFTYGMMAMGLLVFAVGVLIAWLALTGAMTFE